MGPMAGMSMAMGQIPPPPPAMGCMGPGDMGPSDFSELRHTSSSELASVLCLRHGPNGHGSGHGSRRNDGEGGMGRNFWVADACNSEEITYRGRVCIWVLRACAPIGQGDPMMGDKGKGGKAPHLELQPHYISRPHHCERESASLCLGLQGSKGFSPHAQPDVISPDSGVGDQPRIQHCKRMLTCCIEVQQILGTYMGQIKSFNAPWMDTAQLDRLCCSSPVTVS